MFRSPLGAVVAAVGLGVLGILFGVQAMGAYGLGVFILLPFAMGFVAGSLYDAPSTGRAVLVGLVPPIVVAAILLLVALEGALCIAMAAPLALPLSALGAAAAHWQRRDARAVGALALSVPLFMGFEAGADRQPEVHPIRTSVVVEAPPSVVWRHVLSFPPLPAPREAVFRAGIAYPVGATIEGRGVGAIRRCRFSTGDFVEPITAWEPPRRLAFDVSAQPAPMRELSPWGDVHAPHLDGFLRSHRGEFRLTPLPGGRTLLEGTTWYENRMWPQAYWRLWSDDLIHAIHRRVLRHVAAQAEADPRA
ncbi:MAG TPA: SRPBCC family protein [Solirubrobacteraceae bacterium]